MNSNGFSVIVPENTEKGALPVSEKNGCMTILYCGKKGAAKIEIFEGKISLLCSLAEADKAVAEDFKKTTTSLFNLETVDECVGRVVEATREIGGISLITADHGNADCMLEEDGVSPFTAHTTNQVPFIIVGANVSLRDGRLADIAPTMLDLMGTSKPEEMDGESLIIG